MLRSAVKTTPSGTAPGGKRDSPGIAIWIAGSVAGMFASWFGTRPTARPRRTALIAGVAASAPTGDGDIYTKGSDTGGPILVRGRKRNNAAATAAATPTDATGTQRGTLGWPFDAITMLQ